MQEDVRTCYNFSGDTANFYCCNLDIPDCFRLDGIQENSGRSAKNYNDDEAKGSTGVYITDCTKAGSQVNKTA